MKESKTSTGRKATTTRSARTATATTTTPTTAKRQREQARIARWRTRIENRLAEIGNHQPAREGLEIIEAAAAVSGMTTVDFLLDAMKRKHGLTEQPTYEAKFNREIDERAEDWETRARNVYEKEKVGYVVFLFSEPHSHGLEHADAVEMVRRFFRPGDSSLGEAEVRAIRCALEREREAERNDEVHAHAERAGATDDPRNVPAVKFTDDGDAVTIRCTGKVYQHLAKISEAMNAVGWTDSDHSPATVAEYWVGSLLERIGVAQDEDPNISVSDLTSDIVDSIDTGAEEDDDLDRIRRDELEAAFDEIDWTRSCGMKRTIYDDFTPNTRKAIADLAAERGTTPEAVCARFDELYHGNRHASGRKHDPIFGSGKA